MSSEDNGKFEATEDERRLLDRLRSSKVNAEQALALMSAGAQAKLKKPAPASDDRPMSDGSDPEALVTRRELVEHKARTSEVMTAMQAKVMINEAIKKAVDEDGVYANKPRKLQSIQRDVTAALTKRPELAVLDDAEFVEAVRAETFALLKDEHDAHRSTDQRDAEAEKKVAAEKAAKTGERVDAEAPPKSKVPRPDEKVPGDKHVVKDEKTMKFGLREGHEWPTSDAETRRDAHEAATRFLESARAQE